MLWVDLEETNKPMSSAHRVSVNSGGPRTKPREYWWQKARGEVLVPLTQEREGGIIVFCFSNMGVVRVMKEMKLSCCKCHFEFFLPRWQTMKKDTHPSLLISFFTPTMTARPYKRDEAQSFICTSPIIHLVCPQTFCIRIVFNFSWGDHNTQEKLKTKVLQNFGGQTRCITKDVHMVNAVFEKRSLYLRFYKIDCIRIVERWLQPACNRA